MFCIGKEFCICPLSGMSFLYLEGTCVPRSGMCVLIWKEYVFKVRNMCSFSGKNMCSRSGMCVLYLGGIVFCIRTVIRKEYVFYSRSGIICVLYMERVGITIRNVRSFFDGVCVLFCSQSGIC